MAFSTPSQIRYFALVICLGLLLVSRGHADTAALTYDANGNAAGQQAASAGAPTILSPALNKIAPSEGGVSFSVDVSSSTPVTYQWQLNGMNIAGAKCGYFPLEWRSIDWLLVFATTFVIFLLRESIKRQRFGRRFVALVLSEVRERDDNAAGPWQNDGGASRDRDVRFRAIKSMSGSVLGIDFDQQQNLHRV